MAQQGFRGPKITPKGDRGHLMVLTASIENQVVYQHNWGATLPTRERTLAELRKNR